MARRFSCALHFLCIALFVVFLKSAHGIVGRDLVLTPKQGLQLTGKSIYYEEDATEALDNQTKRPWEHTLKHVTYVTLFTNAAADACAGNVSKLQEYNDFMHARYVQQSSEKDARFGDIVTLANGRLERDARNGTYRFVEGHCGYDCADDRVWALWQVQKIRHRDAERKFRYEMKFSVSPLRGGEAENNVSGRAGKRMAQDGNYGQNVLQTYIQKQADYPQSFGRIIYPEEAHFAERRYDEARSRNFRPSSAALAPQRYVAATPMPQSSYMRGIYQPHPGIAPPLERQRLNIGEYMQGNKLPPPPPQHAQPTATPKTDPFPNLLQLMAGNAYATPTTYRPHNYNNYQTHFAKPEIYAPRPQRVKYEQHVERPNLVKYEQQTQQMQQQPPHSLRPELVKYEQPNQQPHHALLSGVELHKITTPMVTHHFHHHFYMPGNSAELAGSEQQLRAPSSNAQYKEDVANVVTPAYYANFFEEGYAPQKIVFPTGQLEQQRLVHVTPVPPLKKPQIYAQQYPIRIDSKVPLLIYPAPVEDEEQVQVEVPTARQKPFKQSEPMDVAPIRYSEPDPLYMNGNSKEIERQSEQQGYELSAPQLEAPKLADHEVAYNKKSQPDNIADQLPPPDQDQDVRIPYVEEKEEQKLLSRQTKPDLQATPSEQQLKITTEESVQSTEKLAELLKAPTASSSTTTTSTSAPAISTETDSPTTLYSSVEASSAENDIHTTTPYTKRRFVSTSSTETPLRALGRNRPSYGRTSTSSTEQPVPKWKPKRRQQHNQSFKSLQAAKQNDDNKGKPSRRHETKLTTPTTTTTTSAPVTATTTAAAVLDAQQPNEIFQVLTQKSVSKSVSIKVGSNGEEIPVLIDDAQEAGNVKEQQEEQNESVNDINA